MKDAPLVTLVLAVILVMALGWLLVVGRPILLPIVTAAISVYVMGSATEALRRQPVLRHLPTLILRSVVLIAFSLAVVVLALVVTSTITDIVAVLPKYQANLIAMLERIADRYDLDSAELWQEIRSMTIDRINLQSLTLSILGGFTAFGATIFLVIVYAAFMMSERTVFMRKLSAALANEDSAAQTIQAVTDINRKIGDYLAVKTLVNLILGVVSWVILWSFNVDFALFWAIVIGLLNYIPYVGSLLGVLFPSVLSLAQFGSIPTSAALTVLLTGAQMTVGGVLDPRLVGRQLNLSPFVVLTALSFWSSLWGIPGAILAIPLTSIVAIILSRFEATRFVAILLAERVDMPSRERRPPPDPRKAAE